MIYHLSIEADRPQRVAEVIAELWGGIATPFPPVAEGSWMALAGDARNTAVEVYPRGIELHEVPGDSDAVGVPGANGPRSATHFAMATALDADAVHAIAAREGWPIKYRKRGGAFGVLEMWIEGARMVEVLTPPMQHEYLEAMTLARWGGMLAARAARQPLPG